MKKAVELAPKASAREQAYITALTRRFASADPKSDWKQFHPDYSAAMRELVKKYPDDLDAAVIFAESLMMLRPWQLWTSDGKPAEGTLELVAVLESVLKHNPDHPAANHFYIHAVEASPNLERAISSAMRLMSLVPGAGQLVHMPGHIFLQTGDYDLAAKTNIEASAADKAFVDRTGTTGIYPLMYWTHNIHFISYARAQQGRYAEAKAANEMARQIGDADKQMQMLEAFVVDPPVSDLRFHTWDDILAAPAPPAERKLHRGLWQYAQAMALAEKGKVAEASAAREKFEALRKAIPEDSMFLGNNKSSGVLALAAATLDRDDAAGARRAGSFHRRVAECERSRKDDPVRRAARLALPGPSIPRRGAAAQRKSGGGRRRVPRGAGQETARRKVVVWPLAKPPRAETRERSGARRTAIPDGMERRETVTLAIEDL